MAEQQPMRVFYSYSHKDAALRDELETHLAGLKRGGIVQEWSDRDITGGEEWAGEIDENLEAADIILLLISADFINSNYCYDIEMARALERHEARTARVIPIVLRPVEWDTTPFHKLQALPAGAKAVTTWPNRDEAWVDVVRGIRRAIQSFTQERLTRHATAAPAQRPASQPAASVSPTRQAAASVPDLARDVTNDPAYADAIPADMSRRFYAPRIFVYKGKTIVLGIKRTIQGLSLEQFIYGGRVLNPFVMHSFGLDLSPSKPVSTPQHPHFRAVFNTFDLAPVSYVITDSGDLRSIALFCNGRLIFEDET
ncbi:MAG TPA: toll/interleukin-1 receptor domain-containing protein [Ktedonobacterales bacterium]|nr:toll/interleukin-1 receptor domain-containing protein [Ktedonobacterales bacterium]